MNEEKLRRANKLSKYILDLKTQLVKYETLESLEEENISAFPDNINGKVIPKEAINVIKVMTLNFIKEKLQEYEKEFSEL